MKKLCSKFSLTMLIVLIVLLSGMSVYADTLGNLTEDDLVARWRFDETSGNTIYDSLGNYNGTATKTTIIDGVSGKARRFSTGSYIQFSNRIMPVGEKSVRFKVRKSSPANDWEVVLGNIDNTTSYGIYFQIAQTTGKLEVYGVNADGTYGGLFDGLATPYSICDGQWHDILFTMPNAIGGYACLYLDNLSIPVSTTIIKATEIKIPSYNLILGGNGRVPTWTSFIGDLDELEIYNKHYTPSPQNLTATPGDTRVTLTWDAVDGATGYNVKRAATSGGPYETVTSAVYQDNTYIDTAVSNNTTYYYVVTAVNSSGESPDSSEVSATPFAPIVAPDAPVNLTAASGDSKVDLSWNAAAGTVTYTVKRSTADGGPYTVIAEGITATAYTDTSVANGTKYYYVVSAVNTEGESGNSNQVSATPTAGQTGSGKIMIKTDDGLIYSGDLVEQTSEIFKLKNVYLYNGIPSFTSNAQPTYNWEISFFKNKVIWFYFGD